MKCHLGLMRKLGLCKREKQKTKVKAKAMSRVKLGVEESNFDLVEF